MANLFRLPFTRRMKNSWSTTDGLDLLKGLLRTRNKKPFKWENVYGFWESRELIWHLCLGGFATVRRMCCGGHCLTRSLQLESMMTRPNSAQIETRRCP